MAAAGLIDGSQTQGPLLYSAALDPTQLNAAMSQGADLVVTDTNRKQAQRWGSIRDTLGYTEQAGEQPLATDLTDARLPVFPGAGDDAYTVSEQRGITGIRATEYGDPVSYDPSVRPDQAIDGDTDHRVGGRRVQRPHRGPARDRPRPPGHDQLDQPRAAPHGCHRALHHQGDAHLRRRVAHHVLDERPVADRDRPDDQLPDTDVPARSTSPSTTSTSGGGPTTAAAAASASPRCGYRASPCRRSSASPRTCCRRRGRRRSSTT